MLGVSGAAYNSSHRDRGPFKNRFLVGYLPVAIRHIDIFWKLQTQRGLIEIFDERRNTGKVKSMRRKCSACSVMLIRCTLSLPHWTLGLISSQPYRFLFASISNRFLFWDNVFVRILILILVYESSQYVDSFENWISKQKTRPFLQS